MYILAPDSLETSRVVHLFLEQSSIRVFLGVVGCDVILHLMENTAEITRRVTWRARRLSFSWNERVFGLPYWPAYDGSVGLKGTLRTMSLVGFGLAIGLEFLALPYSEQTDTLADTELSDSQKRTMAALIKAGNANREAGTARKEAAQSDERAGKAIKEAATLRKRAEDEALARATLEAAVAPRSVHLRLLVDRLKAFTGTSVVLRYLEDREPKRLAEQLNGAFSAAQWKVVPHKIKDVDLIPLYGVHISINEAWENGDVRILAAVNLAEELRTQPEMGAIFVPRIFQFAEYDPDAIIVEVGLQPERYFEERFFGPSGSEDRRIPVYILP